MSLLACRDFPGFSLSRTCCNIDCQCRTKKRNVFVYTSDLSTTISHILLLSFYYSVFLTRPFSRPSFSKLGMVPQSGHEPVLDEADAVRSSCAIDLCKMLRSKKMARTWEHIFDFVTASFSKVKSHKAATSTSGCYY